MPTAKKGAVIDELTEKLGRINAAALIEYRGLTVAEIGELRGQLRPSNVEVQVTKNTLLREAAHRNDMVDLDELFNGPTAVAFIYGDESSGTKALNDYFRTARVGAIKAGILKGGRGLTAEQFAKLADLPNRETLLAQIAGLLESPLSQLASLFNAPAQQLAYALAAFEDKGGAAATGVNAPAGHTTPTSDEPAPSESVAASADGIAPAATEPTTAPSDAAPAAPLGSVTEAFDGTTLAPVASATDVVGAAEPAPVESATAISGDATPTAPEPVVASTETAPEPVVASTETAPEPVVTSTTVATFAPVESATEPTRLGAEITESVTEPAHPTTETEPATAAISSETETAQEAAADPTSAPESEGSADARP